MVSTPEIKKMYTEIQHQLNNLIPEKWESIYLYASVEKQLNNLERWEMYFYYIPTGLLKKNPINVYEIPSKFNVDEDEYLELVDNLCSTIKKLRTEYRSNYQKDWTNVVIAIKDEQFLIEYNNDNLAKSKYTSKDRHLIFKHKYLNIPVQSFPKQERKAIQNFLENEEYKMIYDRYFEFIPKENVHNRIEYEKDGISVGDVYKTVLCEDSAKKATFGGLFKNKFKKREEDNRQKQNDSVIIQNENAFQNECTVEPRIQILRDRW
jgi:hypothetical protein